VRRTVVVAIFTSIQCQSGSVRHNWNCDDTFKSDK